MLSEIALAFGATGSTSTLRFKPGAMTVFVGPNGSGKSLALREIEALARNGPTEGLLIVDELILANMTKDEARKLVESRLYPPGPNEFLPVEHVYLTRIEPTSNDPNRYIVNREAILKEFERSLENHESPGGSLFPQFAQFFTVRLDGKNRFALTEARPMGDLQLPPRNILVALFKDDGARRKVRQLTSHAFGLHFVIDPTGGDVLRPRWSRREPEDPQEEQSLDARARGFHAEALAADHVSDGVKAFTGLISGLLCSDYRIMLVDEPEAFLHPPLARQLGIRMADLAAERGANVIAATHSADFLMGCVEAGHPANIVRLTYDGGKATARMLPPQTLQTLMRDPLLRSTAPLSALFHSSAVVCEADKDQVFYREINWRLEAQDLPHVRDAVFLRAQNKSTIRRIVKPLRDMGIPAAVIVDIDILKGGDLTDLCNACSVPEALKQGIAATKGTLAAEFAAAKLDMKVAGWMFCRRSQKKQARSY